jgi:hypothetical protein
VKASSARRVRDARVSRSGGVLISLSPGDEASSACGVYI